MNPVGYFLYDQQAEEWEETYAGTPNSVPLYKHPAELTDEEIEECYWGDGYPDNPRHPKEFAYAILRKAQEKC